MLGLLISSLRAEWCATGTVVEGRVGAILHSSMFSIHSTRYHDSQFCVFCLFDSNSQQQNVDSFSWTRRPALAENEGQGTDTLTTKSGRQGGQHVQ